LVEDGTNPIRDLSAGLMPIAAIGEELIVGSLDVADMRDDCEAYGIFVQVLGGA
jgi:hypothetical protein